MEYFLLLLLLTLVVVDLSSRQLHMQIRLQEAYYLLRSNSFSQLGVSLSLSLSRLFFAQFDHCCHMAIENDHKRLLAKIRLKFKLECPPPDITLLQ